MQGFSSASTISSYPKPFKRMLRILLAFLILASLQERALDAARIKKASHFRERLCIEVPSGFEPL